MIGPRQIPRITTLDDARRTPELTVLSALAHGNEPDGLAVVVSAIGAASQLDDDHATLYYDLIRGALNDAARRALEQHMYPRGYEYQSEFARRYFARGREEGALEATRAALRQLVRRRLGELPPAVDERIDACADLDALMRLIVEAGSAADRDAVERLFAS